MVAERQQAAHLLPPKHTSTAYVESNLLLSETKFPSMHADDFPKHILQEKEHIFLAKIHEGGEERIHRQAELPHTSIPTAEI
jgi:hypothetical protein